MKKVSCKPLSFVPEVSDYSRGVFFRKVRSFYSLLSIYSERIFFCKKKLSRKPLSFLPEVSNSSRGKTNYREFLKTPHKELGKFSIIVEGFLKKFSQAPPQTGKQMSIYSERKRR